LTIVLAVLVLPATASAAEKGIETDMTWGISNQDRDRTVADVTDLGARWMRLTMAWSDIETRKGSYSSTALAGYDNAITRAASSGARLVVTVYTSPSWASGSSNRETPPSDPADYANFLRFAAQRWGGEVDAWEIWNEENLWGFWSSGPDPGRYARLLKASYPAVKASDPTARVLFGGTAYNDYGYLEGAYHAVPDLGNYYDVMATHPYPAGGRAPETVWLDGSGRVDRKAFAGYREVRRTMLAHGDAKPLWFTEFGWSTNSVDRGVTEAQQASYLTRALRCVEQDPYVQVAVWYTYRNNWWANDANDWESQLGLVRTDFSRKPAYAAFKSYSPGAGGCAYQYPAAARTAAPATAAPATTAEPSSTTASRDIRRAPRVRVRIVRLVKDARAARRGVRSAPRRSAFRVMGRVYGSGGGRVILRVTCRSKSGARWRRVGAYRAPLTRTGRFSRRIGPLRRRACRLRAEYRAGGKSIARSRLVRFTS